MPRDSAQAIAVGDAGSSPAYSGYVLFMLILGNCLNSMDRSIINILIEPIRHDLHLGDTAIGLITGLGYAACYTACTIPVARMVDRGNRVRLLGIGIAIWSLMTSLTGWATGFFTLLLARFAVGASEATCYPTSLSLIGDYFETTRRPRAIGLFQLGTYGGIIFGAVVTGQIAAAHGWRGAFGILGAPGVIVAVLLLLTVRNPRRGMSDAAPASGLSPASLAQSGGLAAMGRMLRDRTFAFLLAAAVLMALAQIIMGSWVPAFLMRVHGVGQARVGVLAGPVVGLGGVFGTIAGGFLGTWLSRRRQEDRAPLLVMLASAPLAVPALLIFLFAGPLPVALAGGAATAFLVSLHFGPLVAVAIGRAGAHERGTAAALLVIGQFLIGFGLGPLIVGVVSDALQSRLGTDSLRVAMLAAPAGVTLATIFCVLAYRRMEAARCG